MSRYKRQVIAALVLLAGAGVAASLYRPDEKADEKSAAKKDKDKGKAPGPEAAIRKTAGAFVKAFNKGDAKAVAAFWTKDGEYEGPDEEVVRGRAAIEKEYVAFFKANPKAKLEVKVETVRFLGSHTALEEGSLTVRVPGEEMSQSRYSVLHVRDGDQWRMASVREWVPDPATLVSLKDAEWLLGEWTAKTPEGEVRFVYKWADAKVYIRGRYTVKRDGKVVAAGTQIIGKDPNGGLRSWQFDNSGAFGEWSWTRDGKSWFIEAAGTLPDGREMTAVNLLTSPGKDSFTWQSVDRALGETPLPDTAPVKVTRVKVKK